MVLTKILKFVPFSLVALAIVVNLWALYPETTARSELNDNVFAFVLVSQMNKAWDAGHCPISIAKCLTTLTDHWVSTFALGFPLPHYYQHLPHLLVVVLFRFLSLILPISLFTTFEWFKYLLLCIFPLSVYWAARKLEIPPLAAGIASLLAPLISTQYLYGTDFNAVVWRGSGMYTQLWGFVTAPLALGSLYDTILHRRAVLRSSLLLALSFSSHLVFGYIITLTSPLVVISVFLSENPLNNLSHLKNFGYLKKITGPLLTLLLTIFLTFTFLAYWAIPLILDSTWENSHSPWDAREKFDSYGMMSITQKLVNGDLFDANRLPVLTILIAIGFFAATIWFLGKKKSTPASYLLLPLMFIQWYLLYWGRATWGPLIDLLPMSDGIHLHRFINGLHLSGMFLTGIGLSYLISLLSKIPKFLRLPHTFNPLFLTIPVTVILTTIIIIPVYSERLSYLRHNANLIKDENRAWDADSLDFQKTVDYLKKYRPGRIWVGRPGNWGNDFNVGGIHAFMQFSMADIDISGFLPETWSPNSDIEQFFSENRYDHYQAYGLKSIVAPPDHQIPSFAKKVAEFGKFIIYDVPNITEFEIGTIPAQIIAEKHTDFSVLRLWLESSWPSFHAHPAVSLTYRPLPLVPSSLSSITMIDMNNYTSPLAPSPLSIFAKSPFAVPPTLALNEDFATPSGKIISETRGFGNYSAIVQIPEGSRVPLYTILKASYNPSWRAYLDNQPVSIIPVAPVFMAVKTSPGNHTIEFKYGAGPLKTILLVISLGSLITTVFWRKKLTALTH